jgi:hypothetical protein
MLVRHLSCQVGFAFFSAIHSIVQLLFDPVLEIWVVFGHPQEFHKALNGFDVEGMSILEDEVVIGLIRFNHDLMGVLDKGVDDSTFVL